MAFLLAVGSGALYTGCTAVQATGEQKLNLVGEEEAAQILDGLRSAAGFLRYELSRAVKLRVMPKLRFYWDETPDKADRIEAILAEIQAERLEKGKEAAESGKPMDEGMNDAGNQSED